MARIGDLSDMPVIRRRPRWSEIRQNIQFRGVTLSPTKRRLDNALSLDDLRRIARRTTPRSVFDYVDGAAEDEISAARNIRTYQSLTFHPDALRPVDDPDTSVQLF